MYVGALAVYVVAHTLQSCERLAQAGATSDCIWPIWREKIDDLHCMNAFRVGSYIYEMQYCTSAGTVSACTEQQRVLHSDT